MKKSAPERMYHVAFVLTETELRALSYAISAGIDAAHTPHMRVLLESVRAKVLGPVAPVGNTP